MKYENKNNLTVSLISQCKLESHPIQITKTLGFCSEFNACIVTATIFFTPELKQITKNAKSQSKKP